MQNNVMDKLRPHVTGTDTSDLSDLLPMIESEAMNGRLESMGYTIYMAGGRVVRVDADWGRSYGPESVTTIIRMVLQSGGEWSWRRTPGSSEPFLDMPIWTILLQAAQAA